jgi:hypothetical protein
MASIGDAVDYMNDIDLQTPAKKDENIEKIVRGFVGERLFDA